MTVRDEVAIALASVLRGQRVLLGGALGLALLGVGLFILQSWILASLFGRALQAWHAGSGTAQPAGWWLPGLLICLLLRPLLQFGRERLSQRASWRARRALRDRLLRRLAALGPARRALGADAQLASQVLEQVDALDGYISRYQVQRQLVVLVPLSVLLATAWHSPVAAVLLLLSAPLVPLFMVLLGHTAAAASQRQFAALGRMSGRFLDLLRGLRTLRHLQALPAAQLAVEQAAEAYRSRTMAVLRLAFLSTAVLELFASIAIAMLALYLGMGLLGMLPWSPGQAPVPYQSALFVLLLAPEFYAPLRQLGSDYHARAEAQAAVAQMLPLLQSEDAGKFQHQLVPGVGEYAADRAGARRPQGAGPGDVAPLRYAGPLRAGRPVVEPELDNPVSEQLRDLAAGITIRCHALTVADPGIPARLHPLDLHLAPGDRVLVQGASGSGKSTLLHTLLGFLPYGGQLLINGRQLADLQRSHWHAQVSYLAQQPELLPGSIAENLRLAVPHATDRQLIQVLQAVGLWPLVQQLPLQLETPLGERGLGLSGGQLSRLALARLLLRDTPVWLLDEPLAHLDTDTAGDIAGLLERLSRGRTLLLVSHDEQGLAWLERRLSLSGPSDTSVGVWPAALPGRAAAWRARRVRQPMASALPGSAGWPRRLRFLATTKGSRRFSQGCKARVRRIAAGTSSKRHASLGMADQHWPYEHQPGCQPVRLGRLLNSRPGGWLLALLSGGIALFSAVALLALSGWFITASALAGLATGYVLDIFRPAAVIRLLALTRTLGRYGERLASHHAALGLLRDLRAGLFRRISQARSLPARSTWTMHRLVADIDLLDQFPLRVLLPWAWGSLILLLVLGFLAWMDMTLVYWAAPGLLLAWLLPWLGYWHGGRWARGETQRGEQRRTLLLDSLQLLTPLLIWQRWPARAAEFACEDQACLVQQDHQLQLTSVLTLLQQWALAASLLLILWQGGALLDSAAVSIPLLLAAVLGVLGLNEALSPLAGSFVALGLSQAARDRVNALIERAADPVAAARTTPQAPYTLHWDQLGVRWPGAINGAAELDLTLQPGQTLLLYGPSGGGKSTLLQLLAGQPLTYQGRCLLNGQPIEHWDLRRVMGWLPQDVDMFDLPLADNLRLGNPTASDAQLWQVLKDVALDTWVRSHPQQLALQPGELGTAVSGGQARRIALARLLLAERPILLLDEPFAGLDEATRTQVMAALQRRQANGLLIIASHQPITAAGLKRLGVSLA